MLICALCACASRAQDIGSIAGLVTDSSNAPIVGATVSITNRDTNAVSKAVTGSTGLYVATSLRIGTYEIAVEAPGFGRQVRGGIQLQVQDRLEVNFTLTVGDVRQTVEVTGEPPLLQTESTQLGEVVNRKSVVDLPLNGRNFTQLIVTAPGAYVPPPNSSTYAPLLSASTGTATRTTHLSWTESTTTRLTAPTRRLCRLPTRLRSSRCRRICYLPNLAVAWAAPLT